MQHSNDELRDLFFSAIYGKENVVDLIDRWNRNPSVKELKADLQWIQCDKANKEANEEKNAVICKDRYGNGLLGHLSYKDGHWSCKSEDDMMKDPIAFVPLPIYKDNTII